MVDAHTHAMKFYEAHAEFLREFDLSVIGVRSILADWTWINLDNPDAKKAIQRLYDSIKECQRFKDVWATINKTISDNSK